jgi:fucose permease
VGLVIELAVLAAFGAVPAFAAAVALGFLLRFGASFVETSVNVLPVTLQATGAAAGASMMNLMHTFFGVGALLAPVSVGLLVQLTGRWRVAFWAGGLVTAALLALSWAARLPLAAPAPAEAVKAPLPGGGRGGSVRDPFVLAGAVALFLYVGAEVGMSAWVVLYLRTRLGFTPVAATAALTLLWVGITAGRSINSLLAQKVGVRELVLGGAVGGVVCGYALLAARSAPAVYTLLLLFGLFVSGTFPNVMVSINTRYPERVGQVTAVLTMAAAAGSMTFHPIIGALSQALGIVTVVVIPPTLMALLLVTYGIATRRRVAAAAAR